MVDMVEEPTDVHGRERGYEALFPGFEDVMLERQGCIQAGVGPSPELVVWNEVVPPCIIEEPHCDDLLHQLFQAFNELAWAVRLRVGVVGSGSEGFPYPVISWVQLP